MFGPTGGVGRQLLEQALDAGHEVTVLARDPSRLPRQDPRLMVVAGDVTDPAAVARAVRGSDAVLVALGGPALSRSKVRSEGTREIITAMKAQGVRRLLCVSVLGAAESRPGLPWALRFLQFPLYLRRVAADHEVQEALLQDSDASGFGNDEPGLTMKVSRADVAAFMLGEVAEPRYLQQAVGISYRVGAPAA